MANPITSNLARLSDFKSREPRRRFWLYVASLVGAYAVCFTGIMSWTMFSSLPSIQDSSADDVVFPSFAPMMLANSVLCAIIFVLLAAAVARRLHDIDERAWWGLLPAPFLATSMFLMPIVFDSFLASDPPNLGLFGFMFVNNMIYVIMLGLLCIKLVAAGSIGGNRFGPQPDP